MNDGREYQSGDDFGPYRLERRLGGGGFGSVWRARETATGRLVALKILNGRFSNADSTRIRAEVELLAAAASQDSPYVVRVLGSGFQPQPYVVMEYIEGTNLELEIERRGTLPVAEAMRIVRSVAEALVTLSRAGIIHRDIKPANVMLEHTGAVKLTDFGIAKIAGYESVTATGQLPMSAAYSAPEVWGGDPTQQSDLYALGVMAYQCLAGARPFDGSFVQLYEAHRNRQPDLSLLPADVPPALRLMIARCLEKEPSQRPANAGEVVRLLAEAETQLTFGAQEPLPHEPPALGPWLIESPHPSEAWAFLCRHGSTNERAVVEVHFADGIEAGTRLRRAFAANPALVPFGAERLLGTNRLLLRPGEHWNSPPPGEFQFWVARELSVPPLPPEHVSHDLLLAAAASLAGMIEAARAADLPLSLSSETLALRPDGRVLVERPGLAPIAGADDPEQGALSWLRTLPVSPADAALLGRVTDLDALTRLAHGDRTTIEAPRGAPFGVAQVAADRHAATQTTTEQTDLVAIRRMRPVLSEAPATLPPRVPPPITQQPVSTPTAPAPAAAPAGRGIRWEIGAALVATAMLVVVAAFGIRQISQRSSEAVQKDVTGIRSAATTATASPASRTSASTTTTPVPPITTTPVPPTTTTPVPPTTARVQVTAAPSAAPAVQTTGGVSGVVRWNRQPQAGSSVSIDEWDVWQKISSSTTDSSGTFRFADLPPGHYRVLAGLAGGHCGYVTGFDVYVVAGQIAVRNLDLAKCAKIAEPVSERTYDTMPTRATFDAMPVEVVSAKIELSAVGSGRLGGLGSWSLPPQSTNFAFPIGVTKTQAPSGIVVGIYGYNVSGEAIFEGSNRFYLR